MTNKTNFLPFLNFPSEKPFNKLLGAFKGFTRQGCELKTNFQGKICLGEENLDKFLFKHKVLFFRGFLGKLFLEKVSCIKREGNKKKEIEKMITEGYSINLLCVKIQQQSIKLHNNLRHRFQCYVRFPHVFPCFSPLPLLSK